MSATASTSQKCWKSSTTNSEANNSSGDSFSRSSTAKKSAVLSYDELAEWEVGKVLGRETPVSLVSVARENSVRSRLSGSSKRESPRDQFRNGGVAADPLDLDIHMVAAAALAQAKAESKSNEMYALTARDKTSKSDSRSRSKIKSQSGQASKSKGVLAAIINLDESQLKNSTHSYGSNESFVNHYDESEEIIHMKAARDDGPVMEMTEEEGEEAPIVTDDEEVNNVQRGDESSLSNGNEGGDEDESADSHEATFYDTRTNCSKTSKTPSESNTTITSTKSAFPNAIDSIKHSQPPPPPSDELSEPPSPKTLRAIEESQRQRAISEATQTLLGNYELTPEERLKLLKEVQRALDKQGRQHSLMSDAEPEDDTVTWNEDSTFFSHDYDEDEEEGGESTVFTGYTGHTGYTGFTANTDYTGYTTNTGCSNNTGYSSHYTVNTGYSSRHSNHTGHNSVYTSGTGNIDGDLTMTTTMTMDEDGTCFTKEDGSFFTNEESYKLDVKAMDRDEDDDTIAFLAGGCFRPCNPFKNWGTNAKSVLPHDDSSKEKIDQNKESLAYSTVVSSVRSRLKKYNRDDTLSTSESILRDLRSMDSSSTSVDDKRSVQKNPDRPELPDSESKVILNPLTPSKSPYLRKRMEILHGMCFHLDADLESAGENDSLLTNLGMESPVEVGIENRLKFDDDDPSTEEAVDDNIEVDALPSVKHAEPRCESTTERITNNIDKESSEVASAATGGSDSKQEGKDRAAIVEPPVIESILTKPTSDQAKNTAKKSETQSISKPSEFRREMSNAASLATQQASNRTSAINATKKIQERIAIERALAVMHSGLWRSYIDPKTGRKYYSDGKVSTWTPPEGMREDDRENEQKSKVSSRQTKMANASAAVGQWTKTIRNKMSSKRKEGSEAATMNITSRAETKEETIKKKTTPNPAVNERRRNSVTHPKKTTNQQHERKLEVKTERRNAPLHPRDQSATDPTNHNKTGEKSISWKSLTLNDLVKKKSQSANSTDHKKASILNKKSVLNKSSKGTTSPPSNRALRSPTPKKPRVKNSSSSSLTTTNNRKPQSVVTLTSKNQVSSLSSPKIKASKHRAERKTQTSNSKAESIPTSPARTEASTSSESSITKTSPTSSEKERINLQPVSKPVDQTEFVKKEATDGSSIATDNCTADSDASAAAVLMRSINEGSKRVTMITFT